MKTIQINKLIVASLVAFLLSACASSKDYLSESFTNVRNNHKRIAILPFGVQFQNPGERTSSKQKNAFPQNQFGKREQEASLDAQKEFFVDVAKQVEKGRYEIAFQDFNRTNKVLSENGIRLEDIPRQNKADLAKLLGVDAVLFGELVIKVTQMNNRIGPMMPTYRYDDGVETDIKLFDANSGEMLWSTSLSQRPNNRMDTPHQLSSSLINQVAKNLPYRNK